MTPLRRMPYLIADGPTQMAADETLLESATKGVASLRFYGWTEATVSLGYFQPAAERLTDPLLADLPWVRRASGGTTLVHHLEVTYALALPANSLNSLNSLAHSEEGNAQGRRDWQQILRWPGGIHEVLRRALLSLGVDSRLCGSEDAGKRAPVLCFQNYTLGDLLCGRSKIVGSAQRKLRGAVLQHGGILLARSPHTPSLPGIAELTGRALTPQEVAHAMTATLLRSTGWELEPSYWTDQEQLTWNVIREKYASSAWNAKR